GGSSNPVVPRPNSEDESDGLPLLSTTQIPTGPSSYPRGRPVANEKRRRGLHMVSYLGRCPEHHPMRAARLEDGVRRIPGTGRRDFVISAMSLHSPITCKSPRLHVQPN